MKRIRKAITGLVTPVVTFVVVKELGGDQELAIGLSTVLTGFLVHRIPNS